MSTNKYTLAKEAIEHVLQGADSAGIPTDEALSALIISTIDKCTHMMGKGETQVLLTYELDNLGGTLDVVNLRAR